MEKQEGSELLRRHREYSASYLRSGPLLSEETEQKLLQIEKQTMEAIRMKQLNIHYDRQRDSGCGFLLLTLEILYKKIKRAENLFRHGELVRLVFVC